MKVTNLNNAKLVDVAMGRSPADLVIRAGKWVCVQSGEIIPETDIAVVKGRIAYVGPDADHTIGDDTEIIEAEGRYLVPGLLDAHMHVESGMLTISEFVRAVMPHGTTGMFIDPHEIANVFGIEGVRLMADEAKVQPVHVWIQVPSCVPSAPGLETPGASLEPDDIEKAMSWSNVIGLGEVMDFSGVISNDTKMATEIIAAQKSGKVIGGHYASMDLGLALQGYAAGGPEDDHEGTTLSGALARVRAGMKVMMRYGSAWHDVAEQVKAVTEMNLDPRHFLLCTDDSHAQTLVDEGHVNRAVQIAIANGVPPVTAIQMATINTADHFGVSREVGMIAPGRSADILLVSNLSNLNPEIVIACGMIVARNGRVVIEKPKYQFPDWVYHSVKFPRQVVPGDFSIIIPGKDNVEANIIGIIENQAQTKHIRKKLIFANGEIRSDTANDLAKIAIIERHHNTGRVQVGLVQGFGFNVPCAVATTVAHDSHHMLVAGTNDSDMAKAANLLIDKGGGQVVIINGNIEGFVPLPIGGLISNQSAIDVARQASELLAGFRKCGCGLNNPNMQLSLLALVVIPELRLSDLGLVDANNFRFISLVEMSRQ